MSNCNTNPVSQQPRYEERALPADLNSLQEETVRRAAEIEAVHKAKPLSPEQHTAAIVEELNKKLAIVHTTSTFVLIEKGSAEFVLDSKQSLLNLYENVLVSVGEKLLSKAQVWLKSPHRRTFKAIVFDPRTPGHYDGNYNIWGGFAVAPREGACSFFWNHVHDVICAGKESHYLYVRKWLAHLIQKPWVVGTALVLRGKQGTGKGLFVNAIGKLFGQHFAPVASLERILGRFNAHLKHAILIFADEAVWGGNRKEVGALKALITEPRLFIEGKGRDGYWIDNFKHLIVASNEDWAVPLDPDDRRFFILDVSAARKEDTVYFDELIKQLEDGGYEALMYDLMHEDLTGFDPRVMPENYSGFDIKLESASSLDRFIYTSLREGCWDHASIYPSQGWVTELKIDLVYDLYKTWCEREHQSPLRMGQLGRRLNSILHGLQKKRAREEGNRRPNLYLFPSLAECRASFESFYKQDARIWELS